MASSRTGTPRRLRRSQRRLALWAGLSIGWLLPSAGCQVEYAGMTLPSGKYMHDDVQYFPPGPYFPWANTQAATQRARMQAMQPSLRMPVLPIRTPASISDRLSVTRLSCANGPTPRTPAARPTPS